MGGSWTNNQVQRLGIWLALCITPCLARRPRSSPCPCLFSRLSVSDWAEETKPAQQTHLLTKINFEPASVGSKDPVYRAPLPLSGIVETSILSFFEGISARALAISQRCEVWGMSFEAASFAIQGVLRHSENPRPCARFPMGNAVKCLAWLVSRVL